MEARDSGACLADPAASNENVAGQDMSRAEHIKMVMCVSDLEITTPRFRLGTYAGSFVSINKTWRAMAGAALSDSSLQRAHQTPNDSRVHKLVALHA